MLWRDRFFDKIKTQIIDATLKLVERDRRGDVANTSWIKTIVSSLVTLSGIQEKDAKDELQLYTASFERPYLEATRLYYQADSDAFLAQHTLREYMKRVEQALNAEVGRVHLYLHRKSEQAVVNECEQTLIVRRKEALVDEFIGLLENDNFEGPRVLPLHSAAGRASSRKRRPPRGLACGAADMGLAYSLLSRLREGLVVLRESFEKHVRTTGLAAIDSLGETAESVRSQARHRHRPGSIARRPA